MSKWMQRVLQKHPEIPLRCAFIYRIKRPEGDPKREFEIVIVPFAWEPAKRTGVLGPRRWFKTLSVARENIPQQYVQHVARLPTDPPELEETWL